MASGGVASPAHQTSGSLFLAGLLAAALIGSKAVLLGPPDSPRWLLELAGRSWEDVLAAAAFGLVCAGCLRATGRAGRPALVGLGAALALWGVANVGIYGYFRRPFNLHMLDLIGRAADLRSSIASYVTWPRALMLVAVPLAYLLAGRVPRRAPRRAGWVLAALAALWTATGLWVHAGYPLVGGERRMAQSPHRVLLASALERLTGRRGAVLPREFPAEDLLEHLTFDERARAPSTLPSDLERPRNVIVVVLESTSARWLSLYGAPWDTTPNLRKEAAHALVGERCYSHVGYTFCSLMSLAFSIYPGLPWRWRPGGEAELPVTLAEILKQRGYATAFISSGDLDWEGMGYMMRPHFESVLDQKDLPGEPLSSWGKADRHLVDGLLRYLDAPERAGRPFYVVCWTDQAHDPYATSPGEPSVDFFEGRGGDPHLLRYLNVLREVDAQLGRLFDALRARGLDRDTLVVITGDHGEAFGAPHDVRGHGSALYDENVRVPLMLWSPRLFPGGRRHAGIASHVDLAPTIADLLGLPAAGGWQGESLFAERRSARAYFVTGISEYQFGVREGDWKYIYNATLASEQLFHLGEDPDELRDLAASEPERCRRLRQRVAAFIAAEERHLGGGHAK